MKKQLAIQRLIVYILSILVIPFFIVKIASNEKEIIQYFIIYVIAIIPLTFVVLRWLRLKTKWKNNMDVLKNFFRPI